MMNNYCEKMTGIAALTFAMKQIAILPTDAVKKALNRLMHAVSLLPEGDCLALQLSPNASGSTDCFVLASTAESVSADDLAWMFGDCADVTYRPEAAPDSLYADGRRAYLLLTDGENNESPIGIDSDPLMLQRHYRELLKLLQEAGALLRLAAVSDGKGGVGCGHLYVSTPGVLPLRLRAMLTMTFFAVTVAELPEGERSSLTELPCFTDGLAGLAEAVMIQQRCQQKPEQRKETPAAPAVRNTPIEVLDLSVRAFNCLKRAGIHTVETLLTMSDEDFACVRLLGRKSTEEVKEKLAHYQASPAEAAEAVSSIDYRQRLAELIGLAAVKEQVRRIAAFARMKQAMEQEDGKQLSLALNMEFVGNPGTAKTTVARILAGILHEEGLLESAEPVEVGRADLVGRYVGHTAAKVKEVFEQAKGRLLFIDEAYSLVEDITGGYGDEAISTIVQEMENRRHETVVIFAGYQKEMNDLFSRNPGLKSRVPFQIVFSDYTVEEMAQIVTLQAAQLGFDIHADALGKVKALCTQAKDKDGFGNGRFCRNLVENAVLFYATRVYGDTPCTAAPPRVLLAEDFSAPQEVNSPSPAPLGFH